MPFSPPKHCCGRGSRKQKSEASVLRLGINSCLAIWLANMICAWSPRTIPKDGLSGFKDGLSGLKDGLSGFKDGLSGSKDGLSGSKDGLSGSNGYRRRKNSNLRSNKGFTRGNTRRRRENFDNLKS